MLLTSTEHFLLISQHALLNFVSLIPEIKNEQYSGLTFDNISRLIFLVLSLDHSFFTATTTSSDRRAGRIARPRQPHTAGNSWCSSGSRPQWRRCRSGKLPHGCTSYTRVWRTPAACRPPLWCPASPPPAKAPSSHRRGTTRSSPGRRRSPGRNLLYLVLPLWHKVHT